MTRTLWSPKHGAVLVALCWMLPAAASAALRASGTPEVKFTALGPAGLHIVGTAHQMALIDTDTLITVKVPLDELKTGIGLRDRHMQDHLDVEHHRFAVLITPKANLRLPASGSIEGSAHGTLELHGQTHDTTFSYVATRSGSSIDVQGSMHVNMHDYGITVPSYLGVTVKPDVDIDAHFTVVDR